MTDDGQLLHQYLKDKSDAAFAELVRRHLGLVYHSALRQLGGDAHGAKDVAQEVFIQLARYASSVRFHPTLAGWLYQTTHFKAREEIRARRRRQIREQKAQLMHEQSIMPEPAVAWEQLRPILDEIVMDLGPTDREAVILRYFKGQSFSAIGAGLGLSEDAAQKRVDRALHKLRGTLARREIPSSANALGLLLSEQGGLSAPAGLEFSVTGAALASLSHIASPTLNLLQFASSAKAALGSASALGLAAGLGLSSLGLTIFAAQNARGLQTALAHSTQAYADDLARLRLLDQEDQTASRENAGLERQIRAAGTASAAPIDQRALAAAQQADLAAATANGQKFLKAFPQAREAIRAVESTDLRSDLGAFLRSAGVSAAQIQALEDLTAQFRGTHLAVAKNGGFGPTVLYPPSEELRPILGDEGLKQFEDYKRSIPVRDALVSLQVEAGLRGTPVDDAKVNELAQIIANASPSYRDGRDFTMATFDWAAVSARIQAAVPPEQWAAIRSGLLNVQFNEMTNRTPPVQN